MPTNFDNTRIFELPDITVYSSEQEEVEYLSLKGKHLIIAGPGTGKSVLALSRARLLAKKQARDNKMNYNFIVYNVMLEHSSSQLYPELNSSRWQSWFWKRFNSEFGVYPKAYTDHDDSYTLLWENILKLSDCRWRVVKALEETINTPFDFNSFFTESNSNSELHKVYNDILLSTSGHSGNPEIKLAEHIFKKIVNTVINNDSMTPLENTYLVIDEGQDMPTEFYKFILGLGCENIFIAADQNQQITDSNSDIDELKDIADIADSGEPNKFTKNFRQANGGYYVAVLAQEFHCDEATPKTDLPEKSGSIEVPLIFDYDHQKRPFNKICQQIINSYLLMPSKLIGIITPDNKIREKYYFSLEEIIQNEENDILLTTYFNGKDIKNMSNMRFDKGGIMVINAQSCKGLEFDRVYIADINKFQVEENSDVTKKLFYVMTSRAREKLIMLRDVNDDSCPVIDNKILPTDENILKRYHLPE
jgi:DNA polymerase III delta prime subunit